MISNEQIISYAALTKAEEAAKTLVKYIHYLDNDMKDRVRNAGYDLIEASNTGTEGYTI